MRLILLTLSLSLAGCASPAENACALIGQEAVEQVIGAKATRMELDKGRNSDWVSGSACLMDFTDGTFVRLAVEEYSDLDRKAEFRDETWLRNRASQDMRMSEELGFPAYHTPGSQKLEADINDHQTVFIRMEQRGAPASVTTAVEGDMLVSRFDRPETKGAREKARELVKLVKF